jgi:hypothetical protein
MMCDRCRPVGDHNKPYRFGDLRAMMIRLSTKERRALIMLKQAVHDVRNGYTFGPAWGDIAADGEEWKFAPPEDRDAA